MTATLRLVFIAAAGAALFLACGSSDPSGAPDHQPGPPELRFLNSMQKTSVGGNRTDYRVRNLRALDSTWSEEIAFGENSAYKLIVPRSTDFTVLGECRPEAGGSWAPVQWTERINPDTGGPFTVELTFGQ